MSKGSDYLLAMLTGGLVVVSALQWWEIRAGSADTHALAEASKKQAEALSINAKTTYESFVATSRAWIDLVQPMMKNPVLGRNIQVSQDYGNIGHTPTQTANGWFGRMYDIGEFNRDFLDDVKSAKRDCIARNLENSNILGMRFPGSNESYYFNYNEIRYQNEAIIADDDFLSGRTIFVFQECFIYKVGDEIKHTYACFMYQHPKTGMETKKDGQPGAEQKPADQAGPPQETQIPLEDCPQGSFAD